ncbi:MAG: TolC family protein [Bryobacteraceae bacterium]
MRKAWIFLIAAPLLAEGPLALSLKRAVQIAVSPEGNTNIQLSAEGLKQAQMRSLEARAALLPDVEGSVTVENRTENLAALGIRVVTPIPGFAFPTFVGPFSTFDARATATQSVVDFGAFRRLQASKAGVTAARSDSDSAAELVAANTARAYLAAVKADADVETAQANVTLSQALLTQARNQKDAGTGTGIEITRANVQLANDRQHLLVTQTARRAAHMQLLRAMNMRLDTDLDLTDKLQYAPVDSVTLEAARKQALAERADLRAQEGREENARLSDSAVRMQRFPSLAAFGDYGSIGSGPADALPTRTIGVSLKVPIFNGGRREAERAESASQYRAEKVRTNDLKQQVELDVRLALDELQSAEDEVKVAQEGLTLSENELAQARRRYDAGIAISVEVTDAQTRLERARDNRLAALYSFNIAKIDLAQATGKVRASL